MRKTIIFLIFVIMITCSSSAHALELGLRGYYWIPELSGEITDDISKTAHDLSSKNPGLGLVDESYPIGEFYAGFGKSHLAISTYSADYSGNGTVPNFLGHTTIGKVNTGLEMDVIDFTYAMDLFSPNIGIVGISLGIVLQAKNIDGLVSADDEIEEFSGTIPMGGVKFDFKILLINGRLMYTTIGGVTDYRADLSMAIFPFVRAYAGYRSFSIDEEVGDFEFDFDTSGPYAAVSIGF
ncbi:MAG: hypothetical protein JRJ23_07965 [Deltaproteobacteria bacterium]|nr:hypothetical protein [Deltaproteobacteria bacterium]MBW1914167.1 hypothetical protein [Deltaproteobacteria bacterium]